MPKTEINDETRIQWAQFVAILSAAATLIWMLSRITTQLEGIRETLMPLVVKVEGHSDRIIRLESRNDARAEQK